MKVGGEDHLVMVSAAKGFGRNASGGGVNGIDPLTGKVLWLLLATDGNTTLYLIEPDPAAFRPLASAVLLEPANNWAPIALVDGRLLIRDQKQMKCVQVAQAVK